MTTKKTFNYIGLTIVIAFLLVIIFLLKTCENEFGYQAGTGLGSIADIDSTKYKDEFYIKYVDSFFKLFPAYKKPDSIYGSNQASSYDFLHLTPFYFNKKPKEIYYVQWQGTGFISVRFGYNLDRHEEIFENPRNETDIDEQEKLRIKNRFRHEILDRIDSLISVSKDKDSANYNSSF